MPTIPARAYNWRRTSFQSMAGQHRPVNRSDVLATAPLAPCPSTICELDMAKAPTPEEAARSILAVFKESGARANEVLMLGAVDKRFLIPPDPTPLAFTPALRHYHY